MNRVKLRDGKFPNWTRVVRPHVSTRPPVWIHSTLQKKKGPRQLCVTFYVYFSVMLLRCHLKIIIYLFF